jgi:hypothetical protein
MVPSELPDQTPTRRNPASWRVGQGGAGCSEERRGLTPERETQRSLETTGDAHGLRVRRKRGRATTGLARRTRQGGGGNLKTERRGIHERRRSALLRGHSTWMPRRWCQQTSICRTSIRFVAQRRSSTTKSIRTRSSNYTNSLRDLVSPRIFINPRTEAGSSWCSGIQAAHPQSLRSACVA